MSDLTLSVTADTVAVPGGVIGLLRDLVHEHTGLYYADDRTATLVDRLAPLVADRGFRSFLDYFYLLKYDAAAPEEWGRVLDALSVQETYFWREIDQLRAVVEHVVPACLARLAGAPLRIWSIPCATGEEPLSIAMLLQEAGWFARAPIEIHGTDGSAGAIARARAGRYGERAFRSLPPALRERYFTRADGGWVVDRGLHERVTWSVGNILDAPQMARHATAPIVFCRNLFIYFSPASIRRVVDFFAARMPRPGYLCVGVSESLLKVTTDFDLEEIGGAFLYRKP